MLLSLDEAKAQLNEVGTEDDAYISSLIEAASGLVEQHIGKDIYLTAAEVPEGASPVVVMEALKSTRQAALKAAISLALASLFMNRESDTDVDLKSNPAFTACLAGFKDVIVG